MYYMAGTRCDQVDGTDRTGDGARYLVPSFVTNGRRDQHPGPVLPDRTGDGTRYLVPSFLTDGRRDQHPGPVLRDTTGDGTRYLVPFFLPGTWSRFGPTSKMEERRKPLCGLTG